MTQTQWILYQLKKGKRLTPIQALLGCGCLRLGARIYDLRRAGHDITTRMVPSQHSGAKYGQYTLHRRAKRRTA